MRKVRKQFERRLFNMKKYLRILALVLVFVMGGIMLVSCAKTISGTYKAEMDLLLKKYEISYTFKGSNVTITQKEKGFTGSSETEEFKGTYEIKEFDDGSMEITFDIDGGNDTIKDGTYVFQETEDYIVIGATKYYKQS